MKKPIIIAGAGGHALEIFDLLSKQNEIYFFDDINLDLHQLRGCRVLNSVDEIQKILKTKFEFCIGVGNPNARKTVYRKLKEIDGKFVSIKGVNILSPFSQHSECDIMNYCFVGPETEIGMGTLLNSGVQVHHHTKIGEFCEIGPRAVILGNVTIGNQTFIGSSSTILPRITIGSNVTIGAGSVVTKEIPDNAKAYGVPAKIINE